MVANSALARDKRLGCNCICASTCVSAKLSDCTIFDRDARRAWLKLDIDEHTDDATALEQITAAVADAGLDVHVHGALVGIFSYKPYSREYDLDSDEYEESESEEDDRGPMIDDGEATDSDDC